MRVARPRCGPTGARSRSSHSAESYGIGVPRWCSTSGVGMRVGRLPRRGRGPRGAGRRPRQRRLRRGRRVGGRRRAPTASRPSPSTCGGRRSPTSRPTASSSWPSTSNGPCWPPTRITGVRTSAYGDSASRPPWRPRRASPSGRGRRPARCRSWRWRPTCLDPDRLGAVGRSRSGRARPHRGRHRRRGAPPRLLGARKISSRRLPLLARPRMASTVLGRWPAP